MLSEKQRQQTALRQQRFRERQQEVRRQEQVSKGLPSLPSIPSMPGQARWTAALASATALLEQVSQEMTAYYEARSEGWQESEAGEEFEQRQEAIGEVLSQLEELRR
jgi:hypothetical protein